MSTAFRLTLELAEETRARWQHAADRAGFTLDEWIHEYLDAASDPDAGDVAPLPAAIEHAKSALSLAEHLFQMVDRETWRETGGDDGQGHYEGDYRAESVETQLRDLRAALACPPQQDPPAANSPPEEEEWVCSVCGENHDLDESAECDGCEVIEYSEWVAACPPQPIPAACPPPEEEK